MIQKLSMPIMKNSMGNKFKSLMPTINSKFHVMIENNLVVSENLNSSSFIRPAQYNSEIRGPSSEELKREFNDEDEGTVISDIKSF